MTTNRPISQSPTSNSKMRYHRQKGESADDASEILAVRYINLGVAYYEKGDTQAATVAFADALSMSKHVIEYDDDAKQDDEEMGDVCRTFQPEFGDCNRMITGSTDLSIFLNPIKIPNQVPMVKLSKTLTLISLFNLAICNHHIAIKKNMDRQTLRKALQLYELAYSVQMQEGIDMTLTPTMIIMSNVGHIHKVTGNDTNALQCFQHLLSTLMFLVEAGEKDLCWEFDGFFENILKTVYANAPAAAA